MKLTNEIENRSWPESAEEAIAQQEVLRHRVRLENNFRTLQMIAGVDVSYSTASNLSHAVVVLMELEKLEPVKVIRASLPTTFPYIAGLLSFREIPVLLKALEQLKTIPDMLMVDGQGIAHPRRLGIAAHLGVLTDLPAIGVAKSRLTGRYVEPLAEKGSATPLMHYKEQIGVVLRSKERTNPLFISPGHKVDIETAVEITLRCLTRYRLPEPTRIADKISKQKELFA